MSTQIKWVTAHRHTDVISVEDRILKEERDILK
jgi:hypothetical protein